MLLSHGDCAPGANETEQANMWPSAHQLTFVTLSLLLVAIKHVQDM